MPLPMGTLISNSYAFSAGFIVELSLWTSLITYFILNNQKLVKKNNNTYFGGMCDWPSGPIHNYGKMTLSQSY